MNQGIPLPPDVVASLEEAATMVGLEIAGIRTGCRFLR